MAGKGASTDWNWHNADSKENIIVQPVQAVAIYTNPRGEIVIRQQDSMGEDDSVIIVPRSVIPSLVKALRAEAAKPFTPDE